MTYPEISDPLQTALIYGAKGWPVLPISAATGEGPKDLYIRVGTARQRDQLVPKAQIWARSEQHWLGDLASLRKIEKQSI